MSCSVYGSQILLEGLFDYGGASMPWTYVRQNREKQYNMIRYGSTITMEAGTKV